MALECLFNVKKKYSFVFEIVHYIFKKLIFFASIILLLFVSLLTRILEDKLAWSAIKMQLLWDVIACYYI